MAKLTFEQRFFFQSHRNNIASLSPNKPISSVCKFLKEYILGIRILFLQIILKNEFSFGADLPNCINWSLNRSVEKYGPQE